MGALFCALLILIIAYNSSNRCSSSSMMSLSSEKLAISVSDVPSTNSSDAPSTNSCHPFCIVPDRCESPIRGQFDKIYESGTWNYGQTLRKPDDFYSDAAWPPKESLKSSSSGGGSNLGYPTETSLKIIKETIAKYNASSMIDIPCGDVNWVFDSFVTDSLPFYLGLDIVGAVIKINERRFAHHRNKQFNFWDATACTLPMFQDGTRDVQEFDLVHVRDVIQHMTLDQGVKFFCNVFNSGARVLITTTYPGLTKNSNIQEGGWYKNNLLLEPFLFPKTEDCTPTHPNVEDDLTCVYNLAESWVQEFTSSKC